MKPEFSKIIQNIDSQISEEYLGGCIVWSDREFNNAWTDALVRYENKLTEYILSDKSDPETLRKANYESGLYLNTVLPLIKKYKESKKLDSAQMFLESIA